MKQRLERSVLPVVCIRMAVLSYRSKLQTAILASAHLVKRVKGCFESNHESIAVNHQRHVPPFYWRKQLRTMMDKDRMFRTVMHQDHDAP